MLAELSDFLSVHTTGGSYKNGRANCAETGFQTPNMINDCREAHPGNNELLQPAADYELARGRVSKKGREQRAQANDEGETVTTEETTDGAAECDDQTRFDRLLVRRARGESV